jgi:hypothetical protein
MEVFLAHIVKYLFVTLILLWGGFERNQAVTMGVVGAFLEFMFKIWAGSQSLALYEEIKKLREELEQQRK